MSLLGPFWAPFWSRFGSPVRHYTPFWSPGWPKQAHKREGKQKQKNTGEILGAGRGRNHTVDVVPGHAFSDIRGHNRGFRLRGVAFSGFPGYLHR